MDDIGTVIAGEKEIYYLEPVETKTHIARFYTSDRADGIEAADNNLAAHDLGAKGKRASSTVKTRLDRSLRQEEDRSTG